MLDHRKFKPNQDYYEPMDWPDRTVTSFAVYNQPENHWAEFTEKDKIKI